VFFSLFVLIGGGLYYMQLIQLHDSNPFQHTLIKDVSYWAWTHRLIDSLGGISFFFFFILLLKGINNVFFNRILICWRHIVYVGWLSFWLAGLLALLKFDSYVYGTVGFFLIDFPKASIGTVASTLIFAFISIIILFSLYLHLNIELKDMKQSFESWLKTIKTPNTSEETPLEQNSEIPLEGTYDVASSPLNEEQELPTLNETFMETAASVHATQDTELDRTHNEASTPELELNVHANSTEEPSQEHETISSNAIEELPLLLIDPDPEEFYTLPSILNEEDVVELTPETPPIEELPLAEPHTTSESNTVSALRDLLNTNTFIKIDESELNAPSKGSIHIID
jgi:hypothetical protein